MTPQSHTSGVERDDFEQVVTDILFALDDWTDLPDGPSVDDAREAVMRELLAYASHFNGELERLRAECCRCESCGHIQAEPNWCHKCGKRTRWPEWATKQERDLNAALDRENDAHARFDLLCADLRRALQERGELDAA